MAERAENLATLRDPVRATDKVLQKSYGQSSWRVRARRQSHREAAEGGISRLRCPVGIDAWIQIMLRAVLPWALYERLARKLVGLPP